MIALAPVTDRYAYQRRMLLIVDAHRRALARRLTRIQETMMTGTEVPTLKLTAMQIGVLKRGMNEAQFKLVGSEVGKSSGQLVARNLIIPVTKGVYRLSDEGRATVQQILNGHAAALDLTTPLIDEVSGININDPDILDDRTEVTRWKQVADDRQRKIVDLHKSLDEMGKVADDLQRQIKDFETHSPLQAAAGIDWDQRVINPILDLIGQDYPVIESGELPEMIVRYVSWLRDRARDTMALADERAALMENKNSRIESLSRCIDQLRGNLNARVITPTRAAEAMLALTILDELCVMLPQVEEYRTAREGIEKLKARGS